MNEKTSKKNLAPHLTLPAIFANINEPCRSDGMVDMTDSKSVAGDCVRVQVSSPV